MDKPKLIVITPVRNEAWVLEAFLTHCSSWADYIIIADQHSTDGSREIALRFPKVTLIDNPTDEWVENACRARLLEEAQHISGNKIIVALDADEFLSDGFQYTEGWRHIMESKPNEIFCFRWFNLYGDFFHGRTEGVGAEWAAHFSSDIDIVAEYNLREQHAVHCQRVPCLESERCRYTMIEDIRFIHLGNLNTHRVHNKLDFYQVVNFDKNPRRSNPISLYRSYRKILVATAPVLDSSVRLTTADGSDITPLVRTSDYGQHYIDEIVTILKREGMKKFEKLCIWDNPDLCAAGIKCHPPILIHMIHQYLNVTQRRSDSPLIKAIDKALSLSLKPYL